MQVLNCLEMMAPQLKPVPEMAFVKARGIQASENQEQSFSPCNLQSKSMRYMYGNLRLVIGYQPKVWFVKFLYSLHQDDMILLVSCDT
jgi:hypothetical protein